MAITSSNLCKFFRSLDLCAFLPHPARLMHSWFIDLFYHLPSSNVQDVKQKKMSMLMNDTKTLISPKSLSETNFLAMYISTLLVSSWMAIEKSKSRQPLLALWLDNQNWHWTAFAIFAMLVHMCSSYVSLMEFLLWYWIRRKCLVSLLDDTENPFSFSNSLQTFEFC